MWKKQAIESNRACTKVKESIRFRSVILNIRTPATTSHCPIGDIDQSRDPLKLLLKENDTIKTWETALLGATKQSHLMSVFQWILYV